MKISGTGAPILHWYDFICPFCYVAQSRNVELRAAGVVLIELPFEAHPDIPLSGSGVGPRKSPMYAMIEREAKEARLELRWPPRLPNARLALSVADWVRVNVNDASASFNERMFAAHFARGEDIGDAAFVKRCVRDLGVDDRLVNGALMDGSAAAGLRESEDVGRRAGVRGTPAWLIGGKLASGLQPAANLFALVLRDQDLISEPSSP